jgi:hypothetical protein
MKLFSFLLVSVLLLATSCKRDRFTEDSETVDRLVFGSFYGTCDSDCVHIYQLDNSTIARDDSAKFGSLTWAYKFTTITQLSKPNAVIAKPLLTMVPKELLANSNTTFGCPDCHGQGGLYIIVKTIPGIYRFRLDMDNTADQSAELIAFKAKMIDVLKQIK